MGRPQRDFPEIYISFAFFIELNIFGEMRETRDKQIISFGDPPGSCLDGPRLVFPEIRPPPKIRSYNRIIVKLTINFFRIFPSLPILKEGVALAVSFTLCLNFNSKIFNVKILGLKCNNFNFLNPRKIFPHSCK